VKNKQGYVIPVKGNQKKLREYLLESVRARKPQSSHSYQQKAHGRTINYRVKVWTVSAVEGWAGLRSLILVHREGSRGKSRSRVIAITSVARRRVLICLESGYKDIGA
jgi:hypothetical protein